MSPTQSKVAVEMSAKIVYHMEKGQGDNFSTAKFIVRKGLAVPELRDECYCQLIRLTLRNPNKCARPSLAPQGPPRSRRLPCGAAGNGGSGSGS